MTEGTLYRELSARAFARIDAYEGELYECRTLAVETHAGEPVAARVYVLRPDAAHLLGATPWDRAAFAERSGD